MTHAELTRVDRKGFHSVCPGELAELGEFPDSVLTGTGELADRTVVVYGCECGKILSFDAGAPEVLNVYSRPERVGGLDR